MWQLNGLSYQNGKDMRDFVNSFASILDRLESMGAKIDEDLSAFMLLRSMSGNFESTVEAIETLGDKKLTWHNVCSRLIEVGKTFQNKRRSIVLTGREMITCELCVKRVHEVGRCWKNPDNPHNRLESSSDAGPSRINKHRKKSARVANASKSAARASKAYKARKRPDSSSNDSSSSDKDSDAQRFRLNTAHAVSSALRADAARQSSRIILDSGASTHMCAHETSVPYAPQANSISERANCTIFCTTCFKIELPNARAGVCFVTDHLIYQPARRRCSLQAELLHVI
jgi:gag-polypeptide of LTR copia-type